MLESAENLIELQKIDNRVAELENYLNEIPDELKNLKNEKERLAVQYEKLETRLNSLKVEKNELEASSAEKNKLLDNAQKKLTTVKNNKEYEAVLKELDTLKKEIYEEELKVLELNDEIETNEKDFKACSEKKEQVDKQYEELMTKRDEENISHKQELEELREKRKEAVKSVRKQILSKYEMIRKARNNLAIVRVENETCTGCYMKVPPQLYVEVKKEHSIQQCPNCQRFLYFYEDAEQEKTAKS